MTYQSPFNVTKEEISAATTLFFAFLLLFLQFSSLAAQSPAEKGTLGKDIDSYYERGLKEIEKENIEDALGIWFKAKSNLQEPDIRISQSYIELVTKQRMKEYYEKASELYHWGLTGKIQNSEKERLLRELDLIRPLIENRDYRRYKRAVEQKNSEVLSDLLDFWNSIDPTPLESYNERLLEHWERVAYAKENYSKNSSGELDDRAYLYLKYGEPFYTKQGTFKYKSSLVNMLLKDGIEVPSFASLDDELIAHEQRMSLESKVRQLHSYPRYEVWIYRRLSDDSRNTIFMFGTRDGTSSFRKIHSVDDFIPSEAYRTSGQSNYSRSISGGIQNRDGVQADAGRTSRNIKPKVNISPALILQLMYYDQLAALDEYFGKSYNEMMDRYADKSNELKSGLAREFGTMFGDKLLHIQSAAPPEKSEYADEVLSIPVDNYGYRFINENDEPYFKIFSVSDFKEAAYYDLLKETNTLRTEIANRYLMISGYQLRNNEDKSTGKKTVQRNINSLDQLVSVFDIPYENASQSVVISHELHKQNEMKENSIASNTAFPRSLKGLNNSLIELPEPLNTEKLIMSDVILGYSRDEAGVNQSSFGNSDSLNFNIAYEREIPVDADLVLYYELYNLKPEGTSELAEYSFRYSIKREGRIFRRNDDDQISITINNTATGERDENILTIDTSDFGEGEYELLIEITDRHSESEFTKTIQFTLF